MSVEKCIRCNNEKSDLANDPLCEECRRSQRYLDRIWLVLLGGISGEALGMLLGRKFLSVEIMYLCAAVGLILSALLAGQFLGRLQKFTYGIRFPFQRRERLGTTDASKLLKRFSKERRWIACENTIRRFLSQSDPSSQSPNLAKRLNSLKVGFVNCQNQIDHLLWFFAGSLPLLFITARIDSSSGTLPDLLSDAIPFLPRLNALNADSLSTIIWFILISFALSVALLLLRKQIPKKAINWAIFGCVALMALPLLNYGFSKFITSDALKDSVKVTTFLRTYIQPYLPLISDGVVLFAKTGFLLCYWQALIPPTANPHFSSIPSFPLFACASAITYANHLALFQYMAEATLFLFLLSVSGCFYRIQKDGRQPPWLLIPFAGVIAGILTIRIENHLFAMSGAAVALGVTAFLVSPKKTLLNLWVISKLLALTLLLCEAIRWNWGASATTALSITSIWSIVGGWHVCSQLNSFDATILLRDVAQKTILRSSHKNTEFGTKSLLNSAWYKNQISSEETTPDRPKKTTSHE